MSYWNRGIVALATLLVVVVALACGTDGAATSPTVGPDTNPTVESDSTPAAEASEVTRDLGMARVRWEALGLVDYEFRMKWIGFNTHEFGALVDLRVRDGDLTKGTFASESGLTSEVDLALYETVVGLFDRISDAIVRDAHRIEATYHPEYGYPESVFIDYSEMTVDEELGIAVTKLTAEALGNTHADELAAARGLWLEADLTRYTFTFQQLCFCPPEVTEPVLIMVANGEVKDVSRPSSESHLDPPSIGDWVAVEGLFDLVQGAIDQNADVMEVAYHPEFGYPVSAIFDYEQGPSDEELEFEVSGLTRSEGFSGDGSEADLAAARLLWSEAGPSDYGFVFAWQCFCPADFRGPFEIEVQAGAISSVRLVDTDALLDPSEWENYMTLEGLFGFIEDGFDRNAVQVRVTYDPVLGYPAEAWIDYSQMIIDEERGFSVSEVMPK